MKLIYGHGYNDKAKPTKSEDGKMLKVYNTWVDMLRRCYSEEYQSKKPTYIGCTVSENFKSYSYFYEWCQNQVGFGKHDFQLDKDLVFKGNKLYSENTCFFVPREINSILNDCGSKRGRLPIGVTISRYGGYMVRLSKKCKPSYLGTFSDSYSAFLAYKTEKEKHIKSTLAKYIDEIDPMVARSIELYRVDPWD